MTGIRTELNTALKEALKQKKTDETATIRLILAALKDRDISARSSGNAGGIDDNEILGMLGTMIKQRQESIKMYVDAGRVDLAEKEETEVAIIKQFMPRELSNEELDQAITSAIEETGAESIKDMGKIMGILKQRYAGQVDMKKAGEVVKAKLN